MRKPKKLTGETKQDYIERVSKAYYSNGYHISEIATKLNCSKIDVYNAINDDRKITTEDERWLMMELRNNGLTYEEIGNVLDKSAACVHNRLLSSPRYPKGFKEHTISDHDLDSIKKWYTEGKSLRWIGRQLNMTHHMVRYRLIKCGLYCPKRYDMTPLSSKDKKLIKTMYNNNICISTIVKECGRDSKTVANYINELNKK